MPYPISPLELAKRIVGPRKELPPGSKHSLSHLQDIRWNQLTSQEKGEAIGTAKMVIEFFEETLAQGRQPGYFTLREISFTERARHKGRMGEYGVLTRTGTLQTGHPVFDNEPMAIYRDGIGNWYCRPLYEFEDGRFETKPREQIPAEIGQNPLQLSHEDDGSEIGSINRLRFIVDWQQTTIPDELMLCWRVDVSRVLMRLGWMEARSASFLERLKKADQLVTAMKATEAAAEPLAAQQAALIAEHKATIARLEGQNDAANRSRLEAEAEVEALKDQLAGYLRKLPAEKDAVAARTRDNIEKVLPEPRPRSAHEERGWKPD